MDFQEAFAEMAEKVESGSVSDDAAKVLILAQEHFNHRRDQLQTVLTHKDTVIRFGDDEDAPQFEPGTDLHKGFITGIEIALWYMGEFPVRITERDSEEEE